MTEKKLKKGMSLYKYRKGLINLKNRVKNNPPEYTEETKLQLLDRLSNEIKSISKKIKDL